MFCDIDWAGGAVVFDDLDLSLGIPLDQQLWGLKEDMLQVSYLSGKYLIDVGWYPEFSMDGSFRIVVILNMDWEHPLYEARCSTLEGLQGLMATCVRVVQLAQTK